MNSAGSGSSAVAPSEAARAPLHDRVELDRRMAAPEWWWLALIVAGAVVLRAIGLDSGLWQDEIYATVETIRPPLWQIITDYPADTHHPLYSILAHLALTVFGESPWTVRLPALLFGVATIPALYFLARRIGTRLEAVLACTLLAVSYHHVWFSQNARGYSALAFFATLCAYALLRGIEKQRARWFAAYAVFIALGAYTQLTLVFMAFAHAAICAWITLGPRAHRRIADWRLPLLAFGGGAVLTVLLYLPMLDRVLWWFLERPSRLTGVSTPSWALLEGLRVLALGVGANPAVLLGGGAVLLAGVISYWRQNAIIVWVFLLPGFATLAGALLARGTLYPRFFFYLAALLVLIVVRGALVSCALLGTRLLPAQYRFRRQAIGVALVLIMVLASARSLRYNYRYPKQDFAGAIAYVEQARRDGEEIVIAGASYPYEAYFKRSWPQLTSADALLELRRRGRPVWVLYMGPRYIENGAPGLVDAIEAPCRQRRKFDGTVGGGDIVVCRVDPL